MSEANGTRPTVGAQPNAGAGYAHPHEVRVERGAAIVDERRVRADACVIGTGAGGAPAAKELAEGGMQVVMLEDGEYFSTDDFTARPREMTSILYHSAGQVTTLGNAPIVLPLGRAVGGSTLINSGTSFRTPPAILEMWGEQFGLDEFNLAELDPYFRRVERIQNVVQVPPEFAGRNAHVVKRGADRLGWHGDFIYRNARGCVGSGVCNWGCPTSGKQHTGLTYVPLAWNAGATTITGAKAEEIKVENGRARGVVARTQGGGRVIVDCDLVVVSCGTIQTPILLGRNGIGGESGQLGHKLSIHPATGVRALFDEDIDMASGVIQSYYIDEFADEGIMFEGAAGPPDYIAMSFPYAGERHRDLMLRYRNLSQFGLMVSDESRGSVSERAGGFLIRYDVGRKELAAFKRGIELLSELYFAAGAKVVFPAIEGLGELRDGDLESVRRAEVRPRDLTLLAFHPLGTARADARPDHGVVDADLKVRGVEGVYVADGSVVPSSLGVNPQITIMALASRMAYRLLGKAPPDDEPEPESIAQPRIHRVHATA